MTKGQTYHEASNRVLEWLAKTMASPRLQLRIETGGNQQLEDLLYNWLLVPNPSGRKELAESLRHDFLSTSPTPTVAEVDVEVEVATMGREHSMPVLPPPGPGLRAPRSLLPV